MALKPGIFASVPFAQQHHGTFSGVVSVGETLENSHGRSDSAALQLPLRRSGIVSRSSMTSSTRAGDSFVHSNKLPKGHGLACHCELPDDRLIHLDLPRFRGEAWCWVSVSDWRSGRRPPCRCSSLVRPQRSPFLHPGPCSGSAVARSLCQARAFCAPARACA